MYLHPAFWNTDLAGWRPGAPGRSPLAPAQLAAVTERFAAAAERWRPTARQDPLRGRRTRLLRTDSVEVWLLGWAPGQSLGAHDHGGATGAFTVVEGILVEECLDPTIWTTGRRTTFPAGSRSAFGPEHVHVLGNRGTGPASSVHASSPPGLPARFAGSGAPARAALQVAGAAS